MKEDPNDECHIVRLLDHVMFREHNCFIFEILNTDLYEHMKENDYNGFNE